MNASNVKMRIKSVAKIRVREKNIRLNEYVRHFPVIIENNMRFFFQLLWKKWDVWKYFSWIRILTIFNDSLMLTNSLGLFLYGDYEWIHDWNETIKLFFWIIYDLCLCSTAVGICHCCICSNIWRLVLFLFSSFQP